MPVKASLLGRRPFRGWMTCKTCGTDPENDVIARSDLRRQSKQVVTIGFASDGTTVLRHCYQ